MAVELNPSPNNINTLSVTEFRLGKFRNAIASSTKGIAIRETELRAEEKRPKTVGSNYSRVVAPSDSNNSQAIDLAILAMSHFKLGEKEKAKEYQTKFSQAMTLEVFQKKQGMPILC